MKCPHCAARSPLNVKLGPFKAISTAIMGSAVAMTLSACYGSPCANGDGSDCMDPNMPLTCQPDEVDGDGDGFCGEYDCDDTNPSVHIWAYEEPDDGIDQDCDGSDLVTQPAE